MRRLVIALLLASATARAADKEKPKPAPKARPAPPAKAAPPPESGGEKKGRTYTFTGLDVEGKLRTPQLLYFLNRVKLELDTTAQEKRSFMKELERSADEKGL